MSSVATELTKKHLGLLLSGGSTHWSSVDDGEQNGTASTTPSPDQTRWNAILEQIKLWDRSPDDMADEGIRPPTPELLRLARKIAARLKNADCGVPSSVALNGEGGVVFSWRRGANLTEIDLQVSGKAELLDFKDGKLIDRQHH